MHELKIGLTVAMFACCISAHGECSIFPDHADKFSIGSVAIGSGISSMPKNLSKSPNCVEDQDRNYYDCEYTDSNGVSYLVEGNHVTRIEVRNLAMFKGQLVASLRNGDSILSVLQKFRKLPPKFPTWQISIDQSDGFVIGTSTCIRADNATLWSYYLVFDERGRLTGAGQQLQWN